MVYGMRFKQLPLKILAITFVKAPLAPQILSINLLISWKYQVGVIKIVSFKRRARVYEYL